MYTLKKQLEKQKNDLEEQDFEIKQLQKERTKSAAQTEKLNE